MPSIRKSFVCASKYRLRLCAAVAATATLVALPGCASIGSPGRGDVEAGQLLATQPQSRSLLTEASQNLLVSYATTSFTGKVTVVNGLVAIPKTSAPPGGYRVVSWGAGTSGSAPQCAPSLTTAPTRLEYFNELLRQGYVVLRTDYEGWGAFSGRPILHGRSNANSISDLVVAAHALPVPLSNDWVAAGHSEGGGAVLWVASMPERAKGYRLRGALALAPTGPGVLAYMRDVSDGAPVAAGAQPFISVTALAAAVVDPTLQADALVNKEMQAQLDAARKSCLGALFGAPTLAPGHYLNKGAEFDKLADYLRQQDPTSLSMKVPVFVVQGEKDETTVTPPTTRPMVSALCAKGARIQYKEYAGATHGSVIAASAADGFAYLKALFDGTPVPSNCS